MPHLLLGIVKGNRSPALQSNKPILLGDDLFLHVACKLFAQISYSCLESQKERSEFE